MAEALEELAAIGSIILCAPGSFDRSEMPPLPGFITIGGEAWPKAAPAQVVTYPWRPPLAWAADLALNAEEFEWLKAVNAFLRDGGPERPIVPIQERSLQLFGNEKTLDRLVRGRLFVPGRLSLDLLRARRVSPPFAWRRVGDGPILLVVENSAAFASIAECLPRASPVSAVAYGGGTAFLTAVGYVVQLREELSLPINDIRYFGDLDRRGLAIPIGASEVARELGIPAVRPAVSLWSQLLRLGHPEAVPPLPSEVASELVAWLPEQLRGIALTHLSAGRRLAQEAVGKEVLWIDAAWASLEGLTGTRLSLS
jgi:hypothetical protein